MGVKLNFGPAPNPWHSALQVPMPQDGLIVLAHVSSGKVYVKTARYAAEWKVDGGADSKTLWKVLAWHDQFVPVHVDRALEAVKATAQNGYVPADHDWFHVFREFWENQKEVVQLYNSGVKSINDALAAAKAQLSSFSVKNGETFTMTPNGDLKAGGGGGKDMSLFATGGYVTQVPSVMKYPIAYDLNDIPAFSTKKVGWKPAYDGHGWPLISVQGLTIQVAFLRHLVDIFSKTGMSQHTNELDGTVWYKDAVTVAYKHWLKHAPKASYPGVAVYAISDTPPTTQYQVVDELCRQLGWPKDVKIVNIQVVASVKPKPAHDHIFLLGSKFVDLRVTGHMTTPEMEEWKAFDVVLY